MSNEKVRIALIRNRVSQWNLALHLGISETTLGRKLRAELPEEEQERLVRVIEEIANGN